MAQDETSPHAGGGDAVADITDQMLTEESVFETRTDDPGDPASPQAEIERLTRQVAEEHEAYLRARADFANYKRRVQEENARQREVVNEDLLKRLLPIVDNFERALQSAETTRDYEKLIGGVRATLRQMQDFLSKAGVNGIEAVGQPFDPNFHEAVQTEESPEHPENTVIAELQRGYTIGERVLRPSMVRVATGAD